VRGLAANYTRLHSLGQGGMGEVFLVREEGSGKLRALKALHPHLADEPQLCAMIRDEARLVAAISHPNVASMVDAGEHDGAPFFVMEHVDGVSLRDLLRQATEIGELVPIPVALRICADACAGLHAAHELRDLDGTPLDVVHRDISPHNILVARSGAVKLIDFGVAKSNGRLAPETRSSNELKGKLRYMAPEQALSMRVDRRTDVFGVGAALFHAVVGEAPFDGPSIAIVLQHITSMQPVAIPATVPPPVAQLMSRAMHPLADGRYATALDMRTAIEQLLGELGTPTTSADVARYVAGLEARRKHPRTPSPSPLSTPMSLPLTDQALLAALVSRPPPPPAPATLGMKAAALAVGVLIAVTLGLGVQLARRAPSPAHDTGAVMASE
jgi:eukaryotic-like serine/threonine-protein kinase